jgi:hypothetical protein
VNRILPKQPHVRLDPELYERLREQVLRRDGWRCQCCGNRSNLEVHHKKFRNQGGDDSEQNLINLCAGYIPLRIAAESRRLESGELAGVSPLSRRWLGTAAQATTKAASLAAWPRAIPADGVPTQAWSLDCGSRPVGRWAAVSSFDDSGLVQAGELGHRSRAETEVSGPPISGTR